MTLLKPICLITFALGVAILTEYHEFAEWVERESWIAFPMVLLGGLGICLLWGKEN